MLSEQEVNRAIDRYADMVKRICFCHLKNETETEDVFQEVFLKYMTYKGSFASEEHEKAWIIRVTINACKDVLKSFFRKNTVSIDTILEMRDSEKADYSDVLQAVLELPVKYRNVIYLHYYEQYSAVEIAHILSVKENTIYSILSRGRKMLKDKLGGEDYVRQNL